VGERVLRELQRKAPGRAPEPGDRLTVAKAKVLIEAWTREYNTERPHSALGYLSPAPEALALPGRGVVC